MGAEPKPSITETWCWADGDLVGDEWGWMTEAEMFELYIEDADEPREVLIEQWQRTGYEVRTLFPPLVSCQYEDQEPCEEDAVAWQQELGEAQWMQACERHRRRCPRCNSTSRQGPECSDAFHAAGDLHHG